MSKQVFLLRHGASSTPEGIFQSDSVGLSKLGQDQARKTALVLCQFDIKTIVSSPLARAQETADLVNQRLNVPVQKNILFSEWRKPSQLQGNSFSDPAVEKILKELQLHRQDADFHFSDDESFADLNRRVQESLVYLEQLPEEKILVVTHGHFLRILMFQILFIRKIDQNDYWLLNDNLKCDHCGIGKLIFNKPNWRIISWNQVI